MSLGLCRLALSVAVLLGGLRPGFPADPEVHILLFGSSDDKFCTYQQDTVFSAYQTEFGGRFRYTFCDTAVAGNLLYFHRLEEWYNDLHNDLPAVFIRDRFLSGPTNIRKKLKRQIVYALAVGGAPLPDTTRQKTVSPVTGKKKGVARIVLFHSPDCGYCREVKDEFLPQVIKNFRRLLEVKEVNLETPDGNAFVRYLEHQYHESGNYLPVVFADGKFLSGRNEIVNKLDWWVAQIVGRGGCAFPEPPAGR